MTRGEKSAVAAGVAAGVVGVAAAAAAAAALDCRRYSLEMYDSV